jgi:hypothetical protein
MLTGTITTVQRAVLAGRVKIAPAATPPTTAQTVRVNAEAMLRLKAWCQETATMGKTTTATERQIRIRNAFRVNAHQERVAAMDATLTVLRLRAELLRCLATCQNTARDRALPAQ